MKYGRPTTNTHMGLDGTSQILSAEEMKKWGGGDEWPHNT